MPRYKMTTLMKKVQEQHCPDRDLKDYLKDRVNEVGLSETAGEIGVSKAALGYWLLKMGVRVQRVAVSEGEEIEVRGR